MSGNLRIALAQFDFPVGAITTNAQRVIDIIVQARDEFHADVVVFPEMTLSGMPAGPLLLRPGFQRECAQALDRIASQVQDIVAIVGGPQVVDGVVYSALSVLREGKIVTSRRERLSVGDRVRNGSAGVAIPSQPEACIVEINRTRIGVLLDGDLAPEFAALAAANVDVAVIAAGTPFAHGAAAQRRVRLATYAEQSGLAVAWLNRVGGQDDLVFDGGALLIDGDGHAHRAARGFDEQLLVAEADAATRRFTPLQWEAESNPDEESLVWRALVTGTRDYLHKNGFRRAWIALSGGIDSALVLAIAVEALGAKNITVVRLPSRYTPDLSNDLAAEQAKTLGVGLHTLSIEAPFRAFLETLAPMFAGHEPDLTEENLQSRCRGVLMMALSNKFGGLVLTTGNKSELAVGYGTIYGDTCGGFAPIKGLYKTQVFDLCRWRNAQGDGERIPAAVIARAPSAELRADQRDEDSLPPYPLLDAILARHLDEGQSAAELIAAGFDADTVRRVLHLVKTSEWKRQQYAPGPRLTHTRVGSACHQPITSAYTG